MAKREMTTFETAIDDGFTTINQDAIFYSPDGASPLICAIIGHRDIPVSDGSVTKYLQAIVLQEFQNGASQDGEIPEPSQAGELMLIAPYKSLAIVEQYLGKNTAVKIVYRGASETRTRRKFHSFQIGIRPMTAEERKLIPQVVA
jgi:hypothetical protein